MLMLLMSILQINILGIFGAQAKSVENTRLNMKVEKATIVQVFKEIEKQTQFHFSYNDAYLNEQVKVTLNVQNKRLSEVLNFLTKEVNLQFKQVRGNIHVLNTANTDRNYNPNVQSNAILEDIIVSGAVLHVSGRVTSREDNQPVAGATIRIKGTNKGTVADAQGNYKIEVDDANAVIEISSVGFLKQEIRVGGRSTINVELTADIAKLDEVVVVGYGTQSKRFDRFGRYCQNGRC
jgi:hypothetical protein